MKKFKDQEEYSQETPSKILSKEPNNTAGIALSAVNICTPSEFASFTLAFWKNVRRPHPSSIPMAPLDCV